MKLNSIDEEILEPVARWFRFIESLRYLREAKPKTLVDLGCGPKIRFWEFCKRHNIFFEEYFGVDPLLSKQVMKENIHKNVTLKKALLAKKIPMKEGSVESVVGFAFLEHIDSPSHIMNEAIRVLKPGGIAIFTTPSWTAKVILEFLSFKLGVISRREIEEHKTYFSREMLENCVSDENKKRVKMHHTYFEFGVNNLFILYKKY